MGYYMRFIFDGDNEISMAGIEVGLKSIDSNYNFAEWDQERESAELFHGNELYGEIEINRIGGELMDEEIEELIEDVEDAVGGDKDGVLQVLTNSKAMFVIRVLWQGRETEDTLEMIDPLWEWLFTKYKGLLQADGEGYYNKSEQILKTE